MVKVIVLSALLAGSAYALVGVRLGQHSFVQHVARIARTQPARELGSDIVLELGAARDALKDKLRRSVGDGPRPDER